ENHHGKSNTSVGLRPAGPWCSSNPSRKRASMRMGKRVESSLPCRDRAGVGSVTQNILITLDELSVALVEGLRPYAEARQAVAAVLHRLEAKVTDAVASETSELAR